MGFGEASDRGGRVAETRVARGTAGARLVSGVAGRGWEARTGSEDLLEELVRKLRVLLLRLALEAVHLVHVGRLVVAAVEEDLFGVEPCVESQGELLKPAGA